VQVNFNKVPLQRIQLPLEYFVKNLMRFCCDYKDLSISQQLFKSDHPFKSYKLIKELTLGGAVYSWE